VYWLYNILILITSPVWAVWMWLRARRRKERPNWKERFGNIDIPIRKDGKRIWFHAVSVGEIVASMPILRAIRARLPDHEIVLSVTTSSGHQTASEKAEGLFDHLIYMPVDLARFQLSAMQRVRPSVVAVMETELWFNFLWAAKVFDAKTLLINGRISDRAFPKSKKFAFFYRALLQHMDRCLMQTETDAKRIKELGGQNVEVFGNAKFDQAIEGLDADPEAWRGELKLVPGKPVVVIGSTRGEEEAAFVLDAIAIVGLDRIQVVHAPRHLETVPELAGAVESRFGNVALRSKGQAGSYLILDTYGELAKIYSVADIVVIGGGFSNLGGQNLIQPLAHGKPVLHGPYMQNFREAAESADRVRASITCSTPSELAGQINALLDNPEIRMEMGKAASSLIQSSLGASDRYADAIAQAAKEYPA
jgi:3-deoxy-D-manno-octulosonic-acid transferase